ncbi:MAG: hypothetical protein LJE70_09385 [Chromatiaceae bacterium]|jgi:hypothetical protein|nr:hypothetical protein [Chromatiaceae bacterium]
MKIHSLFEDGGDFTDFIEKGVDASAQIGTITGDKQDQLALRFTEGKAVFVPFALVLA